MRAPTLVLLHGALNDHTVWAPIVPGLAARGWQVLAPDLPGHGAAPGPALASVEDMAAWLLVRLEADGIDRALLAGHSMGSLIALEAAHRAPQRVAGLALLGSTWPMAVSDALLATARDDEAAAIEMVAQWSHADGGSAAADATRALMHGLSRGAPGAALLHTDLQACNAYANGAAAAAAVTCPVLFIQGSQDRMTPPRKAKNLTDAVSHGRIVTVDAGHALMAEQSDAVLAALAAFAAEVAGTDAR
ncbi:alpha/beta fold hydrolase [Massilia sp. TN1-12]|uniref:alpha/beta fold hydrolase n=1 Tax=Massilia paldalensis TaxID=3377675 RepID=UPI00384C8A32